MAHLIDKDAYNNVWIDSPRDLPCGFMDKDSVEYTRADAFIKKAKLWLAEIHRVYDITDEHGFRIELRELQARFENYMKGE